MLGARETADRTAGTATIAIETEVPSGDAAGDPSAGGARDPGSIRAGGRGDRESGTGLEFAWGILGVEAILVLAVVRLGLRGLATIGAGLAPLEWLALAALTAAFVYGEGYRALQRRWVPFVVGRAGRLGRSSPWLWRLLAPLHAMGLVGAPARVLLSAWAGVGAIVAAVLLVRSLPDPWRGITDFAVAAALAWGVVAVLLRARAEPARSSTAGS